MEQYGLIDVLRQYCIDNDIEFLYGTNFYQNIEASSREYSADQLVMGADFNARPSRAVGGKVVAIEYIGAIALGRKFETPDVNNPEGEASLDETYIQKYDRRLKDLSQQLSNIVGQIACDNELETTGEDLRFDINKFDTNIDFVVMNLTYIQ